MKTPEDATTACRMQAAQARVLIALDGSPAALTALPFARRLASQLAARHEAFHVIQPTARAGPAGSVRKRLHLDSESLGAIPLHLQYGEPAAGIVQAGENPTTIMVVLTTHGGIHGGMCTPGQEDKRRLGHVTEAVLAHATHPICIIRPEAEVARTDTTSVPMAWESVPPLRRLLVPLDGSPLTAQAVCALFPFARRCGAEMDLMFIVAPGRFGPNEPGSIGVPAYIDHAVHAWPRWASEVLAWVQAHSAGGSLPLSSSAVPTPVPMQVSVAPEATGDIGAAIVREAVARKVDALVLVRTSRLEPGHGGILRAVLAQTHCPVIVAMS